MALRVSRYARGVLPRLLNHSGRLARSTSDMRSRLNHAGGAAPRAAPAPLRTVNTPPALPFRSAAAAGVASAAGEAPFAAHCPGRSSCSAAACSAASCVRSGSARATPGTWPAEIFSVLIVSAATAGAGSITRCRVAYGSTRSPLPGSRASRRFGFGSPTPPLTPPSCRRLPDAAAPPPPVAAAAFACAS
eukprot:358384-Chlamydomonas_euryale.AAC.2